MSDQNISPVRLSIDNSEIGADPDLGQELFRTDSKGNQIPLRGFDYNREKMKRLIQRKSASDPRIRADAVGLALEEDLRHRKAQFWETPTRPLVAEQFVPMDPEAAAFADADEYLWEKRTRNGKALMHASLNGTDQAPDVSEYAEFQKAKIVNAIISYGWSVQDEMTGGRIGYNFGMRRAQIARDAILDAFDHFLLNGGTFGGATFNGLFTHSGITPVSAGVVGDWYTIDAGGSTDAAEILADFRKMYTAYRDAMYAVSGVADLSPDTVAMSDRMEVLLRHNIVDSTNRRTLLEEMKIRYPEIRNWLFHRDLRDVSASKDRILMYLKNPRVIAGAVPVNYQERPMITEAFRQKVYAYGRVAPVELHDARLIQYMDIAMHA